MGAVNVYEANNVLKSIETLNSKIIDVIILYNNNHSDIVKIFIDNILEEEQIEKKNYYFIIIGSHDIIDVIDSMKQNNIKHAVMKTLNTIALYKLIINYHKYIIDKNISKLLLSRREIDV